MNEAKEYAVNLNITLAEGVILPEKLQEVLQYIKDESLATQTMQTEPSELSTEKELLKAKAHVITTDDMDYTTAKLKEQYTKAKIVTITEREASDLFYKMDATLNGNGFTIF